MNWPEALIEWKRSSMELFLRAISCYQSMIEGKSSALPIKLELEKLQIYRIQLKKTIATCEDDEDTAKLFFHRENYIYLYDLILKYYKARKQQYDERKKIEIVSGALYTELMELDGLVEILKSKIFEEIASSDERITHKILTESLYTTPAEFLPKEMSSPIIQNIGTVNGPIVGIHTGSITYNHNPDVTCLIESLIEKLSSDGVIVENKTDAIADLQVIQAETKKKNPDKGILKLKLPTIEQLAAYGQLSDYAYKLGQFLQSVIG